MNVFSVKSVGLYSIAIGAAIVFFHAVTSYGDANLQAPISVTGNYLINSQKLPSCLRDKTLLLKLQQSGIYLNASLIAIDRFVGADITKTVDRYLSTNNSDIRPTLAGKLIQPASAVPTQKFSLSGSSSIATCAQSSQLEISGSFSEKLTPKQPQQLQGQIVISTGENIRTQSVDFTGISTRSVQSDRSH
jgi:hypothetical protein